MLAILKPPNAARVQTPTSLSAQNVSGRKTEGQVPKNVVPLLPTNLSVLTAHWRLKDIPFWRESVCTVPRSAPIASSRGIAPLAKWATSSTCNLCLPCLRYRASGTCERCLVPGCKNCYEHRSVCIECLQGFYFSFLTKNCQPCHKSCAVCSGPQKNDC